MAATAIDAPAGVGEGRLTGRASCYFFPMKQKIATSMQL